eukprot:Lankesteria_metandrocarpae@DN2224_c0_g1_i1.p1
MKFKVPFFSWLFEDTFIPEVDYFCDWIAPRVPHLLRAQNDPNRQTMTSFARYALQNIAGCPERMLKPSCLASSGVRVIQMVETHWESIYAVIALEEDFKKIVSDLMALNGHAASIKRGVTECDEAMEQHLMLRRHFWVEQQLHMPWFDIQKNENYLLHSKYELSTPEVKKCLLDCEMEVDEWSAVLLAEGESIEMLISSYAKEFRCRYIQTLGKDNHTQVVIDNLKFNLKTLSYIFGAIKPADQDEVERWVSLSRNTNGTTVTSYTYKDVGRSIDFRSKLSPYGLPSK